MEFAPRDLHPDHVHSRARRREQVEPADLLRDPHPGRTEPGHAAHWHDRVRRRGRQPR